MKTKKNVAWAGYGSYYLGPDNLKNHWGLEYQKLSQLDYERLDSDGNPGFFKYQEYLGETFEKYGKYDAREPERFNAGFEQLIFKVIDKSKSANVKSWSVHSSRGDRVPYIIEAGNKWLLTESPFSFMTEDDRYLIMSDILFDILDEKALYRARS